ncbi:hypothetical protein HN51_056009 [Arachis hypogaea]|uniref:Protein indeterminate-domain 4 n=1 Tax=Arachis hypogaea TaxID=3818 RepID=A0A6B9VCV6_ARAHY|nr:protein indeterminate-domain 4, chloroplastic [Arachis ipaensis]XP_016175772.1 protein indeterminate-domain 4, chloroplastic [Arachis ipaensis]XP_025675385.1 protein indeterminate-domain 4, chloroplastic [Arachis hypogaea]QHN78795.1 Protein indeterminate-domain 4 [Arachis hypogaea]
MAAASSTPFLGVREESQSQITHQSSIAASSASTPPTVPQKKRRNQPGTPNPDAEVIALSPKTLMATNRFICEVCNKGFQREQNLQLHRRGHNLPWKLKQKTNKEPKRKVYLCPEPTCVHHDPSRALGDLTGIKKHYSRKHGEKKWKCDKCSKKYAVQSDWKAHSKTCGTREYRCDCGTLFSRRDSFITHRAFCDALAQESARHPNGTMNPLGGTHLYATNTNHMTLGLSQLGTQISQFQNHQSGATHSSGGGGILRLGSAGAAKFEHLIPPLSHQSSSFGHSPQSSLTNPSPFFINDPNQAFEDNNQTHQQGSLFSSKQLHGLMQLPDLQGNTTNTNSNNSSNLFNLSFFPNNNNSSGTIIPDQFNSNQQGTTTSTLYGDQVGSGLSSLFGNSSSLQHENVSPHMSATALLQKAAQMGPTTTTNNNNGSSILRGMCSSSSNKSERELVVSDHVAFGSDQRRSSMENDHHHQQHLHGLMNSIASNVGSTTTSSIFDNVHQGNDDNNNNLSHHHHHHHQFHQSLEDSSNTNKLPQNHLGVSFGGSDKLTLDFLGVGGMVRNINTGATTHAFSQTHREQQQQGMMSTLSSLDSDLKSAQSATPSHRF